MVLKNLTTLCCVSLFLFSLSIHSLVIHEDFNPSDLLINHKPFDCSRLVRDNSVEKPIALHNFKTNLGELNKKKTEYIILKDLYYLLRNKLGWSVFSSFFSSISEGKENLKKMKKLNLGQGYCESITKRGRVEQCQTVDALSITLGCRLSTSGNQSLPSSSTHREAYETNISMVSLEFQHHASGIPKFLSNETIKAEASSYYWCLQSIARVSDSRFVSMSSKEETCVASLPGWTLVAIIDAIAVDKSYRKALATINSRVSDEDPNKRDFLVSIRGSTTVDDWRVNFLYDTVPIEGLTNVRVHRGYDEMAKSIWSTLKRVIVPHAANQTLGEIIVTGRSLGAAVSSVVGMYASLFVEEQKALLKNSSDADEIFEKPHLVLFVPPLIGNQAFVDYLATKTELRVIRTQYDPISFLPCHSAPLCPINMTCSATGELTDPPLALSELPGNVLIQSENLTTYWANSETHFNMLAWHVCAVPCWLSLQVPNVPLDRCFPPEKNMTYQTNHSICNDLSKIFL